MSNIPSVDVIIYNLPNEELLSILQVVRNTFIQKYDKLNLDSKNKQSIKKDPSYLIYRYIHEALIDKIKNGVLN